MWTGTLAEAMQKRQGNLKAFGSSNHDQNYYCFLCHGNLLFAMLTWSFLDHFLARFPSELHLPDESWGTGCVWHQENLLTAATLQPEAALPLLWECARGLTLHKARIQCKKRLLYVDRSLSSSREGVISAGIRHCAWKAICWEGATGGCSLLLAAALISAGLVSDNCLALVTTPQQHQNLTVPSSL